jgi:hypothetical protein
VLRHVIQAAETSINNAASITVIGIAAINQPPIHLLAVCCRCRICPPAAVPAVLQAFLLRKLKLNGSMGLALKLQPILDAAAPRAKL